MKARLWHWFLCLWQGPQTTKNRERERQWEREWEERFGR